MSVKPSIEPSVILLQLAAAFAVVELTAPKFMSLLAELVAVPPPY